jgi:protein tyrosine/serine phosphatase
MLEGIKKKIFNWAAESVGEVEDAIHHPLYGIKEYTAAVCSSDPRLSRGSWPSSKKLADLKAQGFTTVINLCSERVQDKAVKRAKLQSINIPVEDNTVPTETQVQAFLDDVLDSTGETYVHCEQGKGRTGCMVAAFRVRLMNWTVEAALKEAKDFGLRTPCQIEFIQNLAPKKLHDTGPS